MTPQQIEACVEAFRENHPAGWSMPIEVARADVDRLLFVIDAHRRGGALKAANRAYRKQRLDGVKLPPFSVYWATIVRELIAEAARGVSAGLDPGMSVRRSIAGK